MGIHTISLAFHKTPPAARCRTGKLEPERRLEPWVGDGRAVQPVLGLGPAWRLGVCSRVPGTGDGLECREGGGFQNNSYVSGWMPGTWWCPSWERKIMWG